MGDISVFGVTLREMLHVCLENFLPFSEWGGDKKKHTLEYLPAMAGEAVWPVQG